MASPQFWQIVRQNYTRSSPVINGTFALIFLILCGLLIKYAISDYKHDVYIRDFGVKSFGIVIDRSVVSGRHHSYYIDYKYTPLGNLGRQVGEIRSPSHEVSKENYDAYPVGDKIPIKYNPNDPKDTHLDVQGYWSNTRLAISESLEFLIFIVQFGFLILLLWLFVGWMSRLFFPPKGGLPIEMPPEPAPTPSANPYLPD